MKKPRVSLRFKYTVITIILILIILITNYLFLSFSIINRNKQTFANNFIQDTTLMMNFFSETIYEALKFDDDILLAQTFEKVKKFRNIEYAILFDQYKNIKYHSELFSSQIFDTNAIPAFGSLFNQKDINISPAFNPELVENYYLISKAYIDNSGKFYGLLLVKYSTDHLKKLIYGLVQTLQNIMLIVLLISVFLGIIISFLFSHFTTRPIKKIVDSTKIIGKGNLNHSIVIKRNDELGELVDNFNMMVKDIKNAQSIIIEQKQNEEQLEIAKRIQNSILPTAPLIDKHVEISAFTLSAKGIGGDYHYFEKLGDGYYFTVIVDVSGKGISAALVTFMVSIIIDTIRSRVKEMDSGKILTEANKYLSSQMKKFAKFACIMLCIYDANKRTMNFTSCGLGNLHILRNKNEEFEQIENRAIPLGFDPAITYKSKKVELRKNDHVVLFSDGITDARNPQNRSFGFQRFTHSIVKNANQSADTILKRTKKELTQFADMNNLFDDMSLAIFKIK